MATPGTKELCTITLSADSSHIQEEDAAFAHQHGFFRHHPALPLYTADEAEEILQQTHPF